MLVCPMCHAVGRMLAAFIGFRRIVRSAECPVCGQRWKQIEYC